MKKIYVKFQVPEKLNFDFLHGFVVGIIYREFEGSFRLYYSISSGLMVLDKNNNIYDIFQRPAYKKIFRKIFDKLPALFATEPDKLHNYLPMHFIDARMLLSDGYVADYHGMTMPGCRNFN